MNPSANLGQSDDRKLFQQFLGQYGGPAFARRARDVQLSYDALIAHCRAQREEWLTYVRLNLGTLFGLAGTHDRLRAILGTDEQASYLNALHSQLQPRLRLPIEPTPRLSKLRGALAELDESVRFFNRRWQTFVRQLDLTKINALRDGYNRFYLMEKECALGSARVARQGFRKLEPLTAEDVLHELPLLAEVL